MDVLRARDELADKLLAYAGDQLRREIRMSWQKSPDDRP